MKCLIILAFTCGFFSINAQHDHGGHETEEDHEAIVLPPHGGVIVDAGKYKLEIIIDHTLIDEHLTVYVLKQNLKEVDLKNAAGNLILKYKDGKTDSLTLTKHSDRFTFNTIEPTKMVNMFFNLTINKRKITGIYYYKGIK